jgi:hypothetical protein
MLAAIILVLGTASSGAATPEPTTTAEPGTTQRAPEDAARPTCRTIQVTGSRLRTRRVCTTARERQQDDDRHSNIMREIQATPAWGVYPQPG